MGNAPTTIAIIDDDDDIREALAAVLVDGGYYPLLAEDAETALEDLRSGTWTPDLIIVDERMPGMNGHSFIQQLERENLRIMPVVLSSALATVVSLSEQCGADACLPKPFEMDELLALLKKLLGQPAAQVV